MHYRRYPSRTASNSGSTGRNVEASPARAMRQTSTPNNERRTDGASSVTRRTGVTGCFTNVRDALRTAGRIVTNHA
jgi:hypothetical protein